MCLSGKHDHTAISTQDCMISFVIVYHAWYFFKQDAEELHISVLFSDHSPLSSTVSYDNPRVVVLNALVVTLFLSFTNVSSIGAAAVNEVFHVMWSGWQNNSLEILSIRDGKFCCRFIDSQVLFVT